jgi:putative membrane protein
MTNALMAFLHHLAAFAVVAAIVVEFVLIRDELNARTVRRLAIADAVLGLSATMLLVVGLLRVFYFEKGAAYYFTNGAFIAKLALFVLIVLASIYPTMKFVGWRKNAPNPAAVPAIQRILHLELIGVALILLAAALMAKGIG